MSFTTRMMLLAAFLVSSIGPAHAEAPAPAADTGTEARFEVSSNACYHRLQALDDIRSKAYLPSDNWVAEVLTYNGDDTVFGVPIRAWDQATVNAFYSSLKACTATAGTYERWTTAFVDQTRAGFNGYLAAVKAQRAKAEAYVTKSESTSGASISCKELDDYPENRGRDTGGAFAAADGTFGKDFAEFTEQDYGFLDQKIDACVALLESVARAGKQDLSDRTARLQQLQKVINTEWKQEQEQALAARQRTVQAKAEGDAKAADAERRVSNPSFLERLGSMMWKAGLVVLGLAYVLTPKTDRRYKSGYKDNLVVLPFVKCMYAGAILLVLIGLSIGQ